MGLSTHINTYTQTQVHYMPPLSYKYEVPYLGYPTAHPEGTSAGKWHTDTFSYYPDTTSLYYVCRTGLRSREFVLRAHCHITTTLSRGKFATWAHTTLQCITIDTLHTSSAQLKEAKSQSYRHTGSDHRLALSHRILVDTTTLWQLAALLP